jgi:magnesium-transporting ATPase (P-type)
MYNAVLTNIQVFIALYAEKTSIYEGDIRKIEAKFYNEGITSQHFNMKVFWGWVVSSMLHGSAIFFLTIHFFTEA